MAARGPHGSDARSRSGRRSVATGLDLAPETVASEPEMPEPAKPGRLVSLDAFRGLTVLGMLLVNNISLDEDTPKTLTHAEWSGAVHVADLVFPWFLFAVGVAIPLAMAKRGRSLSAGS